MLKRLAKYAKQATELVAPLPKLPVELFEYHWKLVVEEHREIVQQDHEDLDDETLLSRSHIREHLDAMVRILVNEDLGITGTGLTEYDIDELGSGIKSPPLASGGLNSGPLKPCLEYMLDNRVWETLCALGLADRPTGMMKLVLQKVQYLLKHIRHPLLPYKSAHQPLCQLVRVSVEVGSPQVQTSLVCLLHTIWFKLRADPSQLQFFYAQPTRGRPEQLLLFSALLPFLHDISLTGNRARAAVLCVAGLEDDKLNEYVAKHTPLCEQLASRLAHLFATCRTPPDVNLLHMHLRFVNALSMASLLSLSALSTLNDDDINDLGLSGDSGGLSSPLTIELMNKLRKIFFEDTVCEALLQTSEAAARDATDRVSGMIRVLSSSNLAVESPLLDEFVTLLVSSKSDSDVNEDWEEFQIDENTSIYQRVQATILHRIDSMAQVLSVSSLQLFSTLLDINNPRVVHSLVLRQLLPGAHLEPISSKEQIDDEEADHYATPPKPHGLQTPMRRDRLHSEENKRHTEQESEYSRQFLTRYPGSPVPPSPPDRDPVKQKLKFEENRSHFETLSDLMHEMDLDSNAISFEAYLTDGQIQAAQRIAAFSSKMSRKQGRVIQTQALTYESATDKGDGVDEMENEKIKLSQEKFYEGFFLSLLFDRLERMLDSTMEENVILTGVLAQIAQYPHEVVHAYMFDEFIDYHVLFAARRGFPCFSTLASREYGLVNSTAQTRLVIRPHVRTLPRVLSQVWKEAQERKQEMGDSFRGLYRQAVVSLGVHRTSSSSGRSASPRGDTSGSLEDVYDVGRQRFVESYIVLEEFLKEIASILQAKHMLTPLRIRLQVPPAPPQPQSSRPTEDRSPRPDSDSIPPSTPIETVQVSTSESQEPSDEQAATYNEI